VFDIDLEHCPQCGGEFKIIAAIEEPAVIVRIFMHLGLPARAPPPPPPPMTMRWAGGGVELFMADFAIVAVLPPDRGLRRRSAGVNLPGN
jgi:hypothetical protein